MLYPFRPLLLSSKIPRIDSSLPTYFILVVTFFIIGSCKPTENKVSINENVLLSNVLNFEASPKSADDRNYLAFSDQGSWFAYGFNKDKKLGFAGPFLMTQENGIWSSEILSQLKIKNNASDIDLNSFKVERKSYNSHLEQTFSSNDLKIKQTLLFLSPHTALQIIKIENTSNDEAKLNSSLEGKLLANTLKFSSDNNSLYISTSKSDAKGYIRLHNIEGTNYSSTDTTYQITLKDFSIKSNENKSILLTHTFIFPRYNLAEENSKIGKYIKEPLAILQKRIKEKENEVNSILKRISKNELSNEIKILVNKSILTMQNNWRVPAGELKHSGLFPSYHYKWFHGFWAWDSWKHAVALAYYNPALAKEQVRAMYDYMDEKGFIADCIYRDTTIERHNYRNTKPPLSAWAVYNIYKNDSDKDFINEVYPKIKKQHYWWYQYRDHDGDSLCEYGSTDGTLIAAKWESGMDNAVRFDESKILKNSDGSYSLDQESVDLNSYLYAEKIYLSKIAQILIKKSDQNTFEEEAELLKSKIQYQFYDKNSGWFYDTSIDGSRIINAMGCEGWIPLWANVATKEQAESVKQLMMDPKHFYTKVPFQTLSTSNTKFKPDGGYWRGPNWLDQSYFGVKGLRNYGFISEADSAMQRLINNAEGLVTRGKSIRENYQPITGAGLESENFSWSAAHYLLLILK